MGFTYIFKARIIFINTTCFDFLKFRVLKVLRHRSTHTVFKKILVN